MYKIELLLSKKITSNYVCVEKHRICLIVSVLCKPKSSFFIKQLELLGPVSQSKGGRDILRACLAAKAVACRVIHCDVENLNVQKYKG